MSVVQVQRARTEAYQQAAEEVLTALGTDARHGLSAEDARARLAQYGLNEVTSEDPSGRIARHPLNSEEQGRRGFSRVHLRIKETT
jgi:magnesium-transporting ATPase (P-type)